MVFSDTNRFATASGDIASGNRVAAADDRFAAAGNIAADDRVAAAGNIAADDRVTAAGNIAAGDRVTAAGDRVAAAAVGTFFWFSFTSDECLISFTATFDILSFGHH